MEGVGKEAWCPHTLISTWDRFFPSLTLLCRDYRLSGRSRRNRQTDDWQADRQTNQRMSRWWVKLEKIKWKGGQRGKREALVFRLEGENTYPVRLNQSRRVEEGGWGAVGWGRRVGIGWGGQRAERDRMRKERGSDSDSQSSSKGNDLRVKKLKFSALLFLFNQKYFYENKSKNVLSTRCWWAIILNVQLPGESWASCYYYIVNIPTIKE